MSVSGVREVGVGGGGVELGEGFGRRECGRGGIIMRVSFFFFYCYIIS